MRSISLRNSWLRYALVLASGVLIGQIFATLFGGDRNAVRELAEVFRVNAEAASKRGHDLDSAALDQFAAEFVARTQRTWWDSLIDGLNRLPRPLLALWALWALWGALGRSVGALGHSAELKAGPCLID